MITQIKNEDYTDKHEIGCARMENRDILTERIIASCFKVHNELGPGLVEKIYQRSLIYALKEDRLKVEGEKEFDVHFSSIKVGSLRVDLIVENKVIVEIKALSGNIPDIFRYQLLSYLKVSGLKVGLLVNFGNINCRIKRLVN